VTIPDITLPALQSLELAGYAEGYLKTLVVPALRHFRVSELFLELECVETLAAFISKSHCQLEELCVTDSTPKSRDSYRDAFPLITVSFVRFGYFSFFRVSQQHPAGFITTAQLELEHTPVYPLFSPHCTTSAHSPYVLHVFCGTFSGSKRARFRIRVRPRPYLCIVFSYSSFDRSEFLAAPTISSSA
jgi:hypothetical protein